MRIAFVSANREVLPDPVVPLGLLCVMSSTPQRHQKQLIVLCFEDEPVAALTASLRALRPELVAMGLRNIQNADYTNIEENLRHYEQLVATVRASVDAPLVLGGSGFSVMPAELMERLRPDFGLRGEGEGSFVQLLDCLERGGQGLDEVGNLYRFRDDQLVANPAPREFLDLRRLPFADRSCVDERYYDRTGTESLQTKRGCPLECTYCTYPLIEGRVGRQRDPVAVADELQAALAQHPAIRHFFITDSVFNLPARHAKAVCRELARRDLGLPWTRYANPIGFDQELAELMAAAGCSGVEIGTDSGCDEVLRRLKKGFDTREILRLHQRCDAVGIKDCHTFVLGTEGESLDDVRRSLDFLHRLRPYTAILMIWMDDLEALDGERSRRRRDFREQVAGLLRERCGDNPRWVAPQLRIHFNPRVFRLLRRRGWSGPLWQYAHMLD